jgi:hypothetical protein
MTARLGTAITHGPLEPSRLQGAVLLSPETQRSRLCLAVRMASCRSTLRQIPTVRWGC